MPYSFSLGGEFPYWGDGILMSDNKKYYYLKLKENYFEQDHIKLLERGENGHTYSLIILKLYLKSLKGDGRLMMTDTIPYSTSDDDVEALADVIGHDPDHLKEALRKAKKLDMIQVINAEELWMADIQNYIGQSSTEGDRKRKYRKMLEKADSNALPSPGGQMSDERPPESELEKEKESEKESLGGDSMVDKCPEYIPSSTEEHFRKYVDTYYYLSWSEFQQKPKSFQDKIRSKFDADWEKDHA